MKVYIIQFDWSNDYSESIELFVYDSYDKAYDKFKELIADERNPDISWIGKLAWDGNKNRPIGGYVFEHKDKQSDDTEVYWRLSDECDWEQHSFIELRIKEVM